MMCAGANDAFAARVRSLGRAFESCYPYATR